MPTATRLVSAICYAALAWFVSAMIVAQMPPEAAVGAFFYVNAGVALVLGWWMTAGLGRQSVPQAITQGITVIITITIVALFLNCFALMIERAFDKKYPDPMDAVADVFALMGQNFQIMATAEILLTLLMGGAVIGILSQLVTRIGR